VLIGVSAVTSGSVTWSYSGVSGFRGIARYSLAVPSGCPVGVGSARDGDRARPCMQASGKRDERRRAGLRPPKCE
jgi:hypothetical protein